MKATIRINEKVLETTGTGSLIGRLAIQHKDVEISKLEEVILEFEQTSLRWRQNHGGPALWVSPEYAFMCFVEDLLWFHEHGVKVSVKEVLVDKE